MVFSPLLRFNQIFVEKGDHDVPFATNQARPTKLAFMLSVVDRRSQLRSTLQVYRKIEGSARGG